MRNERRKRDVESERKRLGTKRMGGGCVPKQEALNNDRSDRLSTSLRMDLSECPAGALAPVLQAKYAVQEFSFDSCTFGSTWPSAAPATNREVLLIELDYHQISFICGFIISSRPPNCIEVSESPKQCSHF